MRILLLSCCLISLAVTGFGQTSGARNPAAFSDEEVVISMNGYQLAGTLSLPRTARRPVPAGSYHRFGAANARRSDTYPRPGELPPVPADRRTPRRARDRRAARG